MTKMGLLLLYGLCAWGAALNFPAWAILFARRLREPKRGPWWGDVLMLVRGGLTSLSFGVAGLAGVRLYADLTSAEMLSVPNPIALLFIGCMALAEPMFLRVDDLHCRSRGGWSRSWAIYWAGAVAWTLYVIVAG